MYSLYIYYRADPGCLPRLQAALRELHAGLERAFGLSASLLCSRDDPAMLMEVYESVEYPDELLRELDAGLGRIGFDGWLAAGATRHIECFRPCA